jgi:hypothetical protein
MSGFSFSAHPVSTLPVISRVEEDFYRGNGCSFIEDWEGCRRILTLELGRWGVAVFDWELWVEPDASGHEVVEELKHLDLDTFYWPWKKVPLVDGASRLR